MNVRKTSQASTHVARVLPPRAGTEWPAATLLSFPATAAAVELVCAWDPLVGIHESWWVRASTSEALDHMLSLIQASWPGIEIEYPPRHRDPASVGTGERALAAALRPRDDAVVRVVSGGAAADAAMTLRALTGSARLGPRQRVIIRLTGQAAPTREATRISGRRLRQRAQRGASQPTIPAGGLWGVGAAGAAALGAVAWYGMSDGGTQYVDPLAYAPDIAGYALQAGALGIAGVAAWRSRLLRRLRPLPLPDEIVDAKLADPLVYAAPAVIAIGPEADGAELRSSADDVTAAWQRLAGDQWEPYRIRPERAGDLPRPRNCAILTESEAGALFPAPVRIASASGVERAGARRIRPTQVQGPDGILVGTSDVDPDIAIRQPPDLIEGHQVVVGKPGAGKSTLVLHLGTGIMAQQARAAAHDLRPLLWVIDPHGDLAEDLLAAVPAAIADRVAYLDFSARDCLPAINLLDAHAHGDRDRHIEHLLRVLRLHWADFWGPRMEALLRVTLLTLYADNQRRPPAQQHTILDASRFISDPHWRADVFRGCGDPRLPATWSQLFDDVRGSFWAQVAQPALNKLARYETNETARHIFGSSESTVTPRALLADSDVVIVNSATRALGEEAAELITAPLVNLLGLAVMGQGSVPREQRRRVYLVVDEAATLAAIDYRFVLAELRKFGLRCLLVSQGLSTLDARDRDLTQAILTNCDGLTISRTSAVDAARLVPELGGEITVEDIVALGRHSFYARWATGDAKPPAFSFRVARPAPPGQAQLAQAAQIRARSRSRYAVSVRASSHLTDHEE